MVVLKNRRIRKKIYQKIPSLIQPIGHLSVSRSPNFNFTRKNLIQATIKSKNITILANERCLVKKYRNFIPFFFSLPLFLSTCEYIHNCSNHLISTNETKFARLYWLIPSIGLSLSFSLSLTEIRNHGTRPYGSHGDPWTTEFPRGPKARDGVGPGFNETTIYLR